MTISEILFSTLPLVFYLEMTLQLTDLWKESFCKFSLNKIPKIYLKLYTSLILQYLFWNVSEDT